MAMTMQCCHFPLQVAFVPLMSSMAMFHCLQWGELSKRPQAGAGGMPDLALQLRVSKNALRSPAFQEEIVSQVCSLSCQLSPSDLFCYGHSSKTPCSGCFLSARSSCILMVFLIPTKLMITHHSAEWRGAMTLHCLLQCRTYLLVREMHANADLVRLHNQAFKRLLALTAELPKGRLFPYCAIMHSRLSSLTSV